jgi:hypothetical protein
MGIGLSSALGLGIKRIGSDSLRYWPNPLTTLQLIGDTHFGAVDTARTDLILADAPLTPLAHVQTGDIIDTEASQDAAALAFLAALPADAYTVMGGHDVYGDFRTPEQWATVYSMAGQNYTVDLGPFVLIAIAPDDAGATLSAVTLAYLDTQLTATAKACVIGLHVPLYNSVLTDDLDNYFDSLISSFQTKDHAALWSILAAHDNAVAVISGHTHSRYTDQGYVKTVQCGTHYMAIINNGSPYYNNKNTIGNNPGEIVVTNYLEVSAGQLRVGVRDHTYQQWRKVWTINLATGLSEIAELTGGIDLKDTNSVMTLTGNDLVVNGEPAAGDGFFFRDVVLRSEGYAFCFDVTDRTTTAATSVYLGLGTARNESTIVDIGFLINAATQITPRNGASSLGFVHTIGAGVWSLKLVMRSSGGFLLARDAGDPAGEYKIVYIYGSKTAAMYAKMRLATDAVNFALANLEVKKLAGAVASDWGMVTERKAVSADGDTLTETANAWVEHTITAATGVTQEIMFHRTDDDNTWICRMDQAGGTIKLITKAAGTETERHSAAQTWTNGTQYRVLIYHNGSTYRTYVDDMNKNSAGLSFQNTVTGVKVSHAGANLASWPLAVTP